MEITRRTFIKAMASTSLVPLSYSLARPTIEEIHDKVQIGIDFSKGHSQTTVAYLYKFKEGKLISEPVSAEQFYKQGPTA